MRYGDVNDLPASARPRTEDGGVYRAILESTDQGFCTIEVAFDEHEKPVDYRFLQVSPSFERQTGIENAAGRWMREIAPDQDQLWFDIYGRVARTGEPERFQNFSTPLDRWWSVYAFKIEGPARIAVLFNDITDRKRAETALQASEEQFEALLKQAPLGVYLVDSDFVIRHVNPVALPVFGDIAGGAVGRNFDEVIHILWDKDYADEVVRIFRHTLDFGEPYVTPERAEYRADRNVIEYYEWRLDRILLSGGQFGVVCYFRDISAQVNARKEIEEQRESARKSEKKFAALFDNMAEGFALFDVVRAPGGRIIDFIYREANKAVEHQTGFGREKIIGQPLTAILTPSDAARFFPVLARAADPGEPATIEEYAEVVDRWFEMSAYPHGQDEVVAFYRDISERKRAEAVLRESEERQAFLLKLSDALRPLADPDEIQFTATRLLGERLHVTRVFYLNVEPDGDSLFLQRDYVDGVPSIAGQFSISQFDSHLAESWRGGRTVHSHDVQLDQRYSLEQLAAFDATQARAWLGVPLVKAGSLVAVLGISHAEPRPWTKSEITLVEEVAERTWAAVERARAEAASKRAEVRVQQLVALADVSNEFFGTCDMEFMPTYGNAAAMRLVGLADLDQVKQTPLREFFFPEDLAFITDEFFPRVLREGQGKTEIRFRHFVTGEPVWVVYDLVVLKDEMGQAIGLGTVTHDITESKRTEAILRASERHQGLLLAELQHRVRNILTMVRSVARRTADNCEDVDDYVRHLDGRLTALSRVQTILTRDPGQGVNLHDMVLDELKSQAASSAHYQIEGPEVELAPKAAEVLSLAIHELATNSTKYGVLSESGGTIRIRWSVEDRDGQAWLRWTWHEPVGAKTRRPARTGFGTELIRNRVPYELRGTGEMRIGDDEVEATIDFPLACGETKPVSIAADKDMGQ